LSATRVLIVDDEPDILLMLRLTLEAEGFVTALAADGEKAIEWLDKDDFDVMLLDVMMPVLDGWGVLERLQGRDQAPVIIVVSAKTAAHDVARARELGAREYVTKPFAVPDLVKLINASVGG
jgi:DNA-binding response OmpR family regulator